VTGDSARRASNSTEREKDMKKAKLLVSILFVVALFCTGVMFAQKRPTQNVSGKRHPNLAAAQRLVAQAFDKITAAQQANEFDMAGHAQKAKELLDQANSELKKAAQEANEK
jgi:F0F1-type ATP synthase membrane subunit b/b'